MQLVHQNMKIGQSFINIIISFLIVNVSCPGFCSANMLKVDANSSIA